MDSKSKEINEQIEYGLDTIDADSSIEMKLADFLLIYKTFDEFNRYFHQPAHYPTIKDIEIYLGDKDVGAYSMIHKMYYEVLNKYLPDDVKESLVEDDNSFRHPHYPYYYKKNKVSNTVRTNGAIGAMLDEYEKSITELKEVISNVSKEELIEIVDPTAKYLTSIQKILSHVVMAGYTYVVEIRKWLGEEVEYRKIELLDSIADYEIALDEMFSFNEKLFDDYPDIQLEEYKSDKKIHVRWGQQYDVEQLYEHAIVHVLRHRRQIEKFKIRLRKTKAI